MQATDYPEFPELIAHLLPVVRAAGDEILKIYQTDFSVEAKQDESPLTLADLASHRVIENALTEMHPKWPVISEESEMAPYSERRQWETYWLVDPLDGTKEFVNRNGEFTVNIALIQDHRPVLGLVGVPVRQEIYTGCAPLGIAEKHTGSDVQSLQPRRMQDRKNLTIVASRSHGGARLESYLDGLSAQFERAERTPVGSSLKLCYLAEGKADIYPRLGPTSEWDIGAAQAVLEAAGGAVWTFSREVLAYNAKESILNPEFVAVADAEFNWWDLLPSLPPDSPRHT